MIVNINTLAALCPLGAFCLQPGRLGEGEETDINKSNKKETTITCNNMLEYCLKVNFKNMVFKKRQNESVALEL